jgi:hypothetical protein
LVIRSLGTVTTDGRYYAGGTMMRWAWFVFGLTACCAWGAESSPHDGSSQVILHCDFWEAGVRS